jgi:SWI/SNF-related matrix-associated actin-dependent regulator of chromatin subfamily A member 5
MIHLYDHGINGILADEMGLGKTLQTISLLGIPARVRGITGPHMVDRPQVDAWHNWMNEFKRWCPPIRTFKFHGNAEEREAQKDNLGSWGFDVCVTSYEMVIKEKNALEEVPLEIHHHRRGASHQERKLDPLPRGENAQDRTTACLSRVRRFRTTCTSFGRCSTFCCQRCSLAEKFDEWFQNGEDGGQGGSDAVVQQLHKVLRPFLLRRLKTEVETSLPPKKETISEDRNDGDAKDVLQAHSPEGYRYRHRAPRIGRLLNIVMQLRKCCNHPYLFQGAEPGPPYITGEHLIENSGKLVLLDKLLPKLQERGSRVLVFSQMTRMIDILEDYCMFRGYKYCRIDGNTSGEDRESQIDDYNAEGSEKFIFLLSTRAGGLGINLYTADVVVLYDSDWNPRWISKRWIAPIASGRRRRCRCSDFVQSTLSKRR